MSKATICDRCKRLIEQPGFFLLLRDKDNKDLRIETKALNQHDFCAKCTIDILRTGEYRGTDGGWHSISLIRQPVRIEAGTVATLDPKAAVTEDIEGPDINALIVSAKEAFIERYAMEPDLLFVGSYEGHCLTNTFWKNPPRLNDDGRPMVHGMALYTVNRLDFLFVARKSPE